jgi:transposase
VRYTRGFKERMVQRMTGPEAEGTCDLSREVGVPPSTLSQWKSQAGKILDMTKNPGKKKQPPNDRTAEEKLRIVMEAAQLSDEELGAFLRKEGVHESHLITWRQTILEALSNSSKAFKRSGKGSGETKKLKALERELRRKEKALAETAALLVLKKKAEAIWGDGDGGTSGRSDG